MVSLESEIIFCKILEYFLRIKILANNLWFQKKLTIQKRGFVTLTITQFVLCAICQTMCLYVITECVFCCTIFADEDKFKRRQYPVSSTKVLTVAFLQFDEFRLCTLSLLMPLQFLLLVNLPIFLTHLHRLCHQRILIIIMDHLYLKNTVIKGNLFDTR